MTSNSLSLHVAQSGLQELNESEPVQSPDPQAVSDKSGTVSFSAACSSELCSIQSGGGGDSVQARLLASSSPLEDVVDPHEDAVASVVPLHLRRFLRVSCPQAA